MYEAYSEIMSLVYAVPNIVVGFTGPIRTVMSASAPEGGEQAPPSDTPYTFVSLTGAKDSQ